MHEIESRYDNIVGVDDERREDAAVFNTSHRTLISNYDVFREIARNFATLETK